METLNGFSDTRCALIMNHTSLRKELWRDTKNWNEIANLARENIIANHKLMMIALEEAEHDKEAEAIIKGGKEALRVALNSIYQTEPQNTRKAFTEFLNKMPC